MAAQTVHRCFLSTSRAVSDAVILSPTEIESGVFCSLFSSDHHFALNILRTTALIGCRFIFSSFWECFVLSQLNIHWQYEQQQIKLRLETNPTPICWIDLKQIQNLWVKQFKLVNILLAFYNQCNFPKIKKNAKGSSTGVCTTSNHCTCYTLDKAFCGSSRTCEVW